MERTILKCYILTTTLFINLMSVLSVHIDTNCTIVYEDVMSSHSRATYFGYSVVIHTGKEHWIQIGVPRGNSSHDILVREPGIVYQCHIGEICDEVNLSGIANEKHKLKESKVNAWIGASMTAIDGSEGERVVVCGHRWKDVSHTKNDVITGACYVIPFGYKENLQQCKLVPFSDFKKYSTQVKIGKKLHWISYTGLGQAGISSHYPKNNDDNELILGAPGVLNWQGATVSYKMALKLKCREYSSKLNNPDFNNQPAYFGYAVSSGHLFRDKGLVYAASAPRAVQGSGVVLLYEYGANNRIRPIIEITGTQLGEYFGASIATADINKDDYDDVIIGAPRYSTPSHPDEGRIYIYLGGGIIDKQMVPLNGEKKNSQFGTTVTAIGDINNDGFEDIAVGAPYSNDNRGTVYIYTGQKNGLFKSQVIEAAQISSSLRGFGISIHHTAETCKRDKAYMAIGAYLSGHVTVLRSYPSISLHMELNSDIKMIEKSTRQFSFTVCSWYRTACGPSQISITRNFALDPAYSRIRTQDENGRKNVLKQELLLQERQRSCNTFSVFIQENNENRNDSIVIEASQMLNNIEQVQTTLLIKTDGTKTGIDKFCRNCSVVNQETSKLSDTLKLPFSDCGDDEICKSELHLQCNFSNIVNGSFVIGSNIEPKLLFMFMNKKEPAYQTILHVQIPEPAKLVRGYKDCYETKHENVTILHCYQKSPLDYNDKDERTIEIVISDLVDGDLPFITFSALLNTTSTDTGSFSKCALDLKLISTASMRMIGESAKEVVSYSSGADVVFEQMFQIYKVGDSPVRKAETTIKVPYLLRISDDEKKEFLSIQLEAIQGTFRIQCKSDGPLHTSSSTDVMPEFQEIDGTEPEPLMTKRDVMKISNHTKVIKDLSVSSSDNILYLNCTNKDVSCQTISCTSGFTDSEALLKIKLIGKLNTSALGDIMKTKNIIFLSTEGKVDVKEPKNIIPYYSERTDVASATISFVPEISAKKVEIWVIAVSAACGVFMLVLIIIVLVKVGFFKREKKEALQQLVAATIAEDFYYHKNNDPIPAQMTEPNDSTEETLASK